MTLFYVPEKNKLVINSKAGEDMIKVEIEDTLLYIAGIEFQRLLESNRVIYLGEL